MKNVKLNEKVINYFEMMIDDFCCGNDNEYDEGTLVSFLFEEIEKGNLDYYDEKDVNEFFEIRKFIEDKGGEIKYIGKFDDEDLEYIFRVIGDDIECSWIEPKWNW